MVYNKKVLFLLIVLFSNILLGQTISLTEISFNYESGNANDAITIKDYLTNSNITAPEYIANTKNDEFAYIMGQGKPKIKVKIDGLESNKNYLITACVVSGNGFSNISKFIVPACGMGTNIYFFELDNEVPNAVGKYDFVWEWKIITYPVNSPYCTSTYTKTTEHTCYVIYDTPKEPELTPRNEILNYACEWASGKNIEDDICNDILNNGFKNNYIYGGGWDCSNLSSDFVRLVSSIGLNAYLHKWASKSDSVNYHMFRMTTKLRTPLNTLYPSFYPDNLTWGYHQWAEAGGYQFDPSLDSDNSIQGDWGDYEDYLFAGYTYIYNENAMYQPNYSGQSEGCEAPNNRTYTGYPNTSSILQEWFGPNYSNN